MSTYNGYPRLNERWRNAPWLAAGLLLAGALLFAADWEADRQEKARMDAFRGDVADMARISESIIAGQLRDLGNSLLVLRGAYQTDPKRLTENVKLLRNGPLADHELLVVVVDRDGYLAYTDAPDVNTRLYLGDRKYFRHFADGGRDQLYIDEPSFGRVTKRYTLPLARPIYDRRGGFLGVVAISVLQQSLVNFDPRLQLSGDTSITLINDRGAIVSRSRDLAKVQGTTIPSELLASLLKGSEGVFSSRLTIDGVERIIAYRHIIGPERPLIVYVEASPEKVLRNLSMQRTVLMWGSGFTALVIMALITVYLKRRKIAAQLIDALRQSREQEYESLTRTSLDGFFIADNEGRILDANDTFCRMLGHTRDKLLSLSIPDIEAADTQEPVAQHMRAIAATGKERFLSRLRGVDGKMIDAEISAQHIEQQGGRFFVFVRDITERKKAEEVLREREDLLAKIIATVPGAVCSFRLSPDGSMSFPYGGERLAKYYGVAPGLPAEDPFAVFSLIHPDDIGHMRETIAESASTMRPWRCEWRTHNPIRGELWLEGHSMPLREPDGSILWHGVVTDITDRKRSEEALRLSEQQLKSYLESAGDAIYIMNVDTGRILNCNSRACHDLGYSRDELVNLSVTDIEFSMATGEIGQIHHAMKSGEVKTVEGAHKRKDGSVFPVEIRLSLLSTAQTELMIAIVRDITERKKTEKLLFQAQKMEAIGTMAGGIAHDFNNILGAISGYTELSLSKIPRDSRVKYYLEQIHASSQRATSLVRQLLEFSRLAETERTPISLIPLIKETIKMLREIIPTTIEIRVNVQTDADTVLGDATQLYQIIMNLCINAYQAMKEMGGKIDVELVRIEVGEALDDKSHELNPGSYLKLTVKDTGEGIDPLIKERIFDPFFTTKKTGEGTGLGLSVVHGIVKSYGGIITVESNIGEGSAFHIYIPLHLGEPEASTKEPDRPQMDGKGRILLVDDEPMLTEMMKEMLEERGYTVLAKTNGNDALDIFRAHPDRFDLIITDQTMPEVTGINLAAKVLSIRPDIPVILCTGFIDPIVEEKTITLGIRAVVSKPVIMKRLISQIQDLLAPAR